MNVMTHIVYEIKNKITNKVYIGYTSKILENRWKEHCRTSKKAVNTPFYNAIKKYGIECWDKKILFECETAQTAKEKEIEMIQKFDSYNNGYNATLGGDGINGIIMSEESNIKRSLALLGKPKNYPRMHGKKHSSETIEKMKKPKLDKSSYQTDFFKEKMKKVQAEYAAKRRALTKEQFEEIQFHIKNNISKKKISQLMNISYDLIKKWSCRKW
jgi:group I intron endonuclease